MKKITLLLVGALLAVGACQTAKTWQATGGSRSDGVVRLSYEYGMLEVPVLDDAAGDKLAADRCRTWGYTGAEPFGGQTQQCNSYSSGSCDSYLVTKEYQCTGQGNGGYAQILVQSRVANGMQ